MPRLSIYVPDDLHELASKWRGTLNLSAICARALREELEAAEGFRTPGTLLAHLKGPNDIERDLMREFGLADAVVDETPQTARLLRSSLGDTAAAYLDRTLQDECTMAVGGGRQMWCVVRGLRPRRLRLQIAAIGVGSNDPRVLHIHPNTLVTLTSVLYSPGADCHLVGWADFKSRWPAERLQADSSDPKYVVVASCAPFERDSGYSRLLGGEMVERLRAWGALGDFAGVFISGHGQFEFPPLGMASSLLTGMQLQALSGRADARVILVAGGEQKETSILATLQARLCNVLVTDRETALALLSATRGR